MYEHTDRPDVFRQALKRCHRTDQQKKVYVYQLYMKNTVEVKIMDFLSEGKSLFSAVVDGKMNLKELLMDE